MGDFSADTECIICRNCYAVCCYKAGANEEEQEEEVPETRIEVEIPKINTDLGRQLHFVKLPNFLSVETRSVDYLPNALAALDRL